MIRIKELINTMSDQDRLYAVILIEQGKGMRYNKKTMSEVFENYGNRGVKSWITDKYYNERGEIRLSLFIELKGDTKKCSDVNYSTIVCSL